MTVKQKVLLVFAAAIPAAVFASTLSQTADYGVGTASGDSPALTIAALLQGHFAAAASVQPFMGLTSILLRLPAVEVGSALGGGLPLEYQLGAFICGWVVAVVAFFAARRMLRPGASRLIVGVTALLMAISPLALGTQLDGHPEELLGGALCVAAVLAAIDDRSVAAGVLLGLAFGTKEWALIAAFPAFLACRHHRWRLLVIAALVGAPLVLTLPLADPGAFARAAHTIGAARSVYPRSWWWPLSLRHTVSIGTPPVTFIVANLPFHLTRTGVSWLPVAAALPLSWCAVRFRRGVERVDPFALLALLLLLRCTLDPEFVSYYLVPAVMALLAWEGVSRPGRLPVGSLLAITLFWFCQRQTALPKIFWDELLCTVGLTIYLSIATFRPPEAKPPAWAIVQLPQLRLKLRRA
jgi:hypothetical protein